MHVVGDDSLESALNDYEALCMDKVYDALDWYQKAVIEAKEIEVHCNIHNTVYFCLLTFYCQCSCNLFLVLYCM